MTFCPMPHRHSTVLLSFLFFFLLSTTAWAQDITRSGNGYTATVEKSFEVEPGGTVDLHATNGRITVSGGNRNEVAVKETIRFPNADRSEVEEYLENEPTQYESTDETVRIRGPETNDDWGWWGGNNDEVRYRYEVQVPRQFSARLRTSGESIEVTDLVGTVDGETAGGSVSATQIEGEVRLQTAGGSVTLRSIDGPADGETAGGSVEAVDVTGSLNVQTAGGSIRVENVGDDVSAETSGGSIQVDSVEGALTAHTAGGGITIRRVAQTVDAETSGGDIDLSDIGGRVRAETAGGDIVGRSLDGAVDAETSAGDVELRGVRGPITAETSVGDVEIEGSATEYSEDPALHLTTSHGDIELILPSSLQASIRAEVHGFPGGRGDIRSDVPLTREGGDGEPLRATGTMNGGGPTIRLKTTGGGIQIRTSDS